SVFDLLAASVHDEFIIRSVKSQVEKVKTKKAILSPGTAAPYFTVEDLDGKRRTLSEFSNKVLYVDVWATTCGPCIAQFDNLAKLAKKFENSPHLEILSLNLDNTKEKWIREGVLKYRPDGIQLWAGSKNFSSEFAINYLVDAIPRYILIDKNGNLITGFAPGPDKVEPMIIAALEP
ncbi:MAG: TlpA family protein disulfide reductase, partial [Chitinophagaceae bacterium]